MKNWLKAYYLQPHHSVYITLSLLKKYFLRTILLSSLSLLNYPTYQHYALNQKMDELNKEENIKQQKVIQNEKLIATLTKNQQKINDSQLAEKNHKIRSILLNNRANIENIQWNLEYHQNVTVIFNQSSHGILFTLKQIASLPQIEINEINLKKLNQNRLIQAYIQLTFNQAGKK